MDIDADSNKLKATHRHSIKAMLYVQTQCSWLLLSGGLGTNSSRYPRAYSGVSLGESLDNSCRKPYLAAGSCRGIGLVRISNNVRAVSLISASMSVRAIACAPYHALPQ